MAALATAIRASGAQLEYFAKVSARFRPVEGRIARRRFR
jgi:hypothetical protein